MIGTCQLTRTSTQDKIEGKIETSQLNSISWQGQSMQKELKTLSLTERNGESAKDRKGAVRSMLFYNDHVPMTNPKPTE